MDPREAMKRLSKEGGVEIFRTLFGDEEDVLLALAVSRLILGNSDAARVHGGGFAGTVQAVVPADRTAAYTAAMDALFGAGSCQILRIRPVGGVKIF